MRQRVFLVLGAAAILSHCATVGRMAFIDPVVSLTEVRIAGLGLTGGTLNLILDVENPNPYRLTGVGFVTTLNLDDTPFGSARWDEGLEVPAEGRATVEIPLQFTWSGVGAGARSLLRSGSVPYRLGGEVTLTTVLGPFKMALANEGSVTMLDLIGRDDAGS